jgi:2-polyprenyl-3-methyl-5-hydroxy-6-metoxy-1,4-benzoquinol methylase
MEAVDVRAYWEKHFEAGVSLSTTGWLGLGSAFNKWMYRVRRARFLEVVPKFLDTRRSNVLDVGSGSGFYLDLWKELGAMSVTGSDFTTAAVQRLKETAGTPIEQLDITGNVGAFGRPFNALSAMDVLYHIVEDDKYQKAFDNFWSLLKPGGMLFSQRTSCTAMHF